MKAIVLFTLATLWMAVSGIKFDFMGEQECDPVTTLLQDPRSRSLRRIIEGNNLTDSYRRWWQTRAGTVLMPTTDAFEKLLDDLDTSLANLTTTLTTNTWNVVLPSYFLSNTTFLPKDMYDHVYQTPGSLFIYTSLFQENSTDETVSILVRYADVVSTIIRAGRTPLANLRAYGKAALVTDFSLVCDQYVVYWLDTVLLPFTDLCALTREGCGEATSLEALVNALQGNASRALAPAPASG